MRTDNPPESTRLSHAASSVMKRRTIFSVARAIQDERKEGFLFLSLVKIYGTRFAWP